MDWKEFFKPTKPKIILTLVFFVIVVLITFSGRRCEGGSFCISGPHYVYVISMIYLLIFGIPMFSNKIYSFVNRPFHPANIPDSLIALLLFLITLLWNYLIACIILFIYNKFKK